MTNQELIDNLTVYLLQKLIIKKEGFFLMSTTLHLLKTMLTSEPDTETELEFLTVFL